MADPEVDEFVKPADFEEIFARAGGERFTYSAPWEIFPAMPGSVRPGERRSNDSRQAAPPAPPATPQPIEEVTVTESATTTPSMIGFMMSAFGTVQAQSSTLLTRTIPTAFERLLQQQMPPHSSV